MANMRAFQACDVSSILTARTRFVLESGGSANAFSFAEKMQSDNARANTSITESLFLVNMIVPPYFFGAGDSLSRRYAAPTSGSTVRFLFPRLTHRISPWRIETG